MTNQLILPTKTTVPHSVYYLILWGPFSDMKLNAKVHKSDFTDKDNESLHVALPLPDSTKCNWLLAVKK